MHVFEQLYIADIQFKLRFLVCLLFEPSHASAALGNGARDIDIDIGLQHRREAFVVVAKECHLVTARVVLYDIAPVNIPFLRGRHLRARYDAAEVERFVLVLREEGFGGDTGGIFGVIATFVVVVIFVVFVISVFIFAILSGCGAGIGGAPAVEEGQFGGGDVAHLAHLVFVFI